MSRHLTRRLGAQFLFQIPRASAAPSVRSLSQTIPRYEESSSQPPRPIDAQPQPAAKPKSRALLENLYGSPQTTREAPDASVNSMSALSRSSVFKSMNTSSIDTSILTDSSKDSFTPKPREVAEDEYEPYHLHIFSTRHNTHVTCTKPNREPIISLSGGSLGYKKHRRGLFDSAYSLTKYVMERLLHQGWGMKIKKLEVVLRGFGPGREAAIKVLMSPEGKVMREKIVRVADNTRLKFGGTRSRAMRRL